MMELDQKSTRALKFFAPQMVTISKSGIFRLILLLIFIVGGIYALLVQIIEGHVVTGMRDNVVWGIYIVNFIFFIGISYAGALISGILHLLRVKWRTPIIRIAEIITVISTFIGPIYILLCMGRLDRLHHLAVFGRIQSPIIWDVLAISTYLIGSIIFLYLASIRDMAALRDYPFESKWRNGVYKFFAVNYRGTSRQNRYLDRALDTMSAIIIPLAVLVHSVLAWIFGMTLRPGWHSTIFAPYFVVAAVFSGTGVLIIALWIFRRFYNLKSYITKIHFNYLGIILMILGALYGYFTFSEYLTSWYGSETWDMEVLYKLFDTSEYWWWFFFAAFIGVLLPIIVILIPKFRNINSITAVSVIAVAALWVKRYLIIIPTLETPLLPLQDMRSEYIRYSPTLVEWLLTFSGVATFFLFFFLFSKLVPIVPVVKADDSVNYSQLRKTVMKRIIKRKIKEEKLKEAKKIEHL
ncbi:MAG: polysulfide reductase NrfD [Cyclobacteriaceae bacterium]|nr:polysulfide reductase NrfD [Cyclobacteriaceae bacterium]